jgi:hypothetical protein
MSTVESRDILTAGTPGEFKAPGEKPLPGSQNQGSGDCNQAYAAAWVSILLSVVAQRLPWR